MKKMNVSMCQICKDPIWSFICPHCLARDISKWLPSKMKGAFREFNESFLGSFSITIDLDGLRCLTCRKIRLANICPFCYMAEVHDWLRERNTRLASTILRFIPAGNDWELKRGGVVWKDGLVPITESGIERLEEGSCDACERHSDELVHVDGSLVCRDCKRGWQVYITGL